LAPLLAERVGISLGRCEASFSSTERTLAFVSGRG
jgi:hypothetical protein